MRRLLPLLLVAACGSDGDDEAISLTITSPADGTQFERASLDQFGTLVTTVPMEIATTGGIDRVAIMTGDVEVAVVADGAASPQLVGNGETKLYAIAFDADGEQVAEAQVTVDLVEPEIANCHEFLDLIGVEFTVVGPTLGIVDPIDAKMPINGVQYRSYNGPRTTMLGDCALIKSLALAAPAWRRRGVVEVHDLGVYNYRCKNNNGTPPNCATGLSEHSFGNAIDIAGFETDDGTTYELTTDWVIDPDDNTCTAPTEPGKDTWLHQMICELKNADVWNIVLTPNFNAAHRDHFHVDLTSGADSITRTLDPPRSAHDGH